MVRMQVSERLPPRQRGVFGVCVETAMCRVQSQAGRQQLPKGARQ